MTVLVAGPDVDGLGDALEARGAAVVRVAGIATRDSLTAAGLDEADTLVLTDMDDASAIPVAKEAKPDVRIVTYATDSLPEFARGQTDLAIDPALLSVDVVADELVEGLVGEQSE
ncbi:CTP synthetase [Halobellus sp. Atlit-31R]|nr:CTP synthetase [Halobellus sp. Atlit-31R]